MYYFFFLIKLLNIYIFIINININDLFTLYLSDENEKKIQKESESNKELDDYNKERRWNLFCLKFIISVAIIGWFKLDAEQIGCVILSNMFSELIEALFSYENEDNKNIDRNNDDEKKKK